MHPAYPAYGTSRTAGPSRNLAFLPALPVARLSPRSLRLLLPHIIAQGWIGNSRADAARFGDAEHVGQAFGQWTAMNTTTCRFSWSGPSVKRHG
ncbi:protein of unknown function [Streptomyces murinus]